MRAPAARTLLRLYPRAWRKCYGDEFAALLEETPLSLGNLADVLVGALDAHCLSHAWRANTMTNRLRRAEFAVFCAYIVFVVAGLGFAKIVEYDDFHDATNTHPLIGIAFTTLVVGAYAGLAAVIAGGLPLAFVAVRQAFAARRWDIIALLVVPPLAFAVFFGYTELIVKVVGPAVHAGGGIAPGTYHLGISLAVVFVLCAIASTVAVTQAIARSEIAPRYFRFARTPTAFATAAMVVVTAALFVWGLSLRNYVPSLFTGNDGLLATSTAANWIAILAIMGLATGFALWATIRGLVAGGTQSSQAAMG